MSENLIIDIYGFGDNQINVVTVMRNLKFVPPFWIFEIAEIYKKNENIGNEEKYSAECKNIGKISMKQEC